MGTLWTARRIALPVVVLLGSCQSAHAQPAQTSESSRPAASAEAITADAPAPGFEVLASDPRVQYEPGSEALAEDVARALSESLVRAEAFHDLRFRHPVPIRVFATRESFARATLSPAARGSVILGTVCLSPKLAEQPETTAGILVHELSHALLQQNVGVLRLRAQLPMWFREGLATLASAGAGAEGVTREEATHAILAGETFARKKKGSLFGRENPALPYWMYYRQCEMFVGYVRERDVKAFHEFLVALEVEDFQVAFSTHLGLTVEEAWKAFVDSLTVDGSMVR